MSFLLQRSFPFAMYLDLNANIQVIDFFVLLMFNLYDGEVLGKSEPLYQVVSRAGHEILGKRERESCKHIPCTRAPKSVTTKENINLVHNMVLNDRMIIKVKFLAQTCEIYAGIVKNVHEERKLLQWDKSWTHNFLNTGSKHRSMEWRCQKISCCCICRQRYTIFEIFMALF